MAGCTVWSSPSLLDANVTPRDSWPLVGEIVLLVVLIVLAHVAERVEVPGDPALVGAVGGLRADGGRLPSR